MTPLQAQLADAANHVALAQVAKRNGNQNDFQLRIICATLSLKFAMSLADISIN